MRRFLFATAAILSLLMPAVVCGQDEDVPLGDVARAYRRAAPAEDAPVIDNDNLQVMMKQGESERLNGKPVFSIDPSGNAFRMTSPDGTCSLSFDANATALISTPFVSSELPQDELAKIEGPATIHDGVLEVSLHNETDWELKEIVVSVTVLQNPPSTELKPATLTLPFNDDAAEKLPDTTLLYHLKATSPPNANTVFRADLGGDIDSSKEWHWALIGARGIPPAAPGSVEHPLPLTVSSGVASLPNISLSETKSVLSATPVSQSTTPPNAADSTATVQLPSSNSAPARSSKTQH